MTTSNNVDGEQFRVIIRGEHVATFTVDCQTTTVATTLDELDGAVCACARLKRTIEYLARLVCLNCSRDIAAVVLADPRRPVRVPPALRCRHCGGQPIVESLDERTLEPKLPRQYPRRGRPPRWLVEQRRIERSA